MSTIIRVKRRCDEEPQDLIIVNCKRQKTEEEQHVDTPTVLQLAVTVPNQEEDALTQCKTSLKENVETSIKMKCQQNVLQSIRERVREECYQNSKENRYKVVNLCRSNTRNDEVTIVDVETQKLQEETLINAESKPQYVYDLYYTLSDDMGEIYDHGLVGIYPIFINSSLRDNDVEDSNDESEDSNAENHWRNDYPDEDEFQENNSVTEENMLDAMQNMDLVGNELSSDDEATGFVYSIDSEAAGFEEDIDDTDVNRYGEQYARFKAKYKKHDHDSVDDDFCYNSDASCHEDDPDSYY